MDVYSPMTFACARCKFIPFQDVDVPRFLWFGCCDCMKAFGNPWLLISLTYQFSLKCVTVYISDSDEQSIKMLLAAFLLYSEVFRWPNVTIRLIRRPAKLVPIWPDPRLRQASSSLPQIWRYVHACQVDYICYYYPRFLHSCGDVTMCESPKAAKYAQYRRTSSSVLLKPFAGE